MKKIKASLGKILIAIAVATAIVIVSIVLLTKKSSVIKLPYGDLKVNIEGYYVTALGELVYSDYGYSGRVYYFLENGISADNVTQDSRAFSVIILPNQDEMWAVLSSILENAADSPYSMLEMKDWYINVWDNWKDGTASVWVAQRGNVLVSAGYPIQWEEYIEILNSIQGSALSLDPVKDSFTGLDRMGQEIQYYEGYGESGSQIFDDDDGTSSDDSVDEDESAEDTETEEDNLQENENTASEETDDLLGDEVPLFFEIGGSAVGLASVQVAFSTFDGYSQRDMMEQFRGFMAEEFEPVVLLQEDNCMLVRAFFDIYDTGELVGYYRLVFVNYDAIISVLWEVIARSYNGYEETDAAVINYIRDWKQNTNLITPLLN